MRRFRITVEGVAYEVTVEELDAPAVAPVPVPTHAPTPTPAAPAARRVEAPPAAPGDVVSPLAGMVVSLSVPVGGRVEAGQPLLVLEAMKMQTSVAAPRAGTVATIAVAAGASVQEGQVLMTLS